MTTENQIEQSLIARLEDLKYIYRPDIRDRAALEKNFREKFEALNRVRLSDAEFARLMDEIINPDVYVSAKLLRERNTFEREDGTPLHYTLVNIKDWCKNDFEVVNQLRINTDNSHHRYDVMLLINGIPVVQIELKTLAISPRRAMQQIVDYKHDPGNGYSPLTDRIKMPHQHTFDSSELFYQVLFHELGHSSGAKHRLARKEVTETIHFGSEPYASEEMVADLCSSYLCAHAGISNETIEQSASYIDGWLSVLRKDKRMVVMAAAQAQKAADLILGRTFTEEESS